MSWSEVVGILPGWMALAWVAGVELGTAVSRRRATRQWKRDLGD